MFGCLGLGDSDQNNTDGGQAVIDGDSDNTEGNLGSGDFTWTVAPSTLSVYFQSAHDSYDTDENLQFIWDFGDGETGEGHSLNHEYAEPGEYTVSLTAKLSDGKEENSSQLVTVDGYGVVKWKFLLEDDEGGLEGGNGSMALSKDGTIYALVTPIGGARIIYSIAPDGTKNWKFEDFDYPRPGKCADPIFSNISQTLYVICNTYSEPFPATNVYITYVTAISASGQKKWTTVVPDEQVVPNLAVALNQSADNLSDILYLAANSNYIEEEIPNTVYKLTQNGNITKSSYESDEQLIGLAFGPSDNLHVLKINGTLEVLNSGMGLVWSYVQKTDTTLRGYMAIDEAGRVFIPLTTPAGLQALQFDVDRPNRLLWTYTTADYPGTPTINSKGQVSFIERGVGITTHEPDNGIPVWDVSQYAYTGVLGIAALENGTIIAEMENAQIVVSSDGERLPWGPPAIVTSVATVAEDGTFYIYGRRDHDTVYSDAIYAIYGPSPILNSWTRHRGDNANTARLLSALED